MTADTEELEEIFRRTFGEPKRFRNTEIENHRVYGESNKTLRKNEYKPKVQTPEYLLVDGYNVIFAWEELSELAKVSVAGARREAAGYYVQLSGIPEMQSDPCI